MHDLIFLHWPSVCKSCCLCVGKDRIGLWLYAFRPIGKLYPLHCPFWSRSLCGKDSKGKLTPGDCLSCLATVLWTGRTDNICGVIVLENGSVDRSKWKTITSTGSHEHLRLYVECFLLSIPPLIPKSFVLAEHCLSHSFLLSSITEQALGTFSMECIPLSMSAHPSFEESKPKIHHLSVSSGNIQLLPIGHGDGIENQYPLPSLSNSRSTSQQYPIPSLKLGSNDGSHHAFDSKPRHHPLKPRSSKRIDPERPYLVHPKYIEYRSRPRQEFGKDGKPIWPDHIEAAFQDGKHDWLI